MNQVHPYEPHRFRSAVPYYERYRLSYPEKLIRRVIALAELSAGDAVLDLGSGPGFLAVPFAQAGMDVTAADPEPAMLEAAGAAARTVGVTLSLWQGGSYDLTPAMGPFRLAAIGRAFHWMDRAATLKMLDRIVAPDGAVAFFHDSHPDMAENRWFKTLREVTDRHSKDGTHIAERKAGGHRRYEPYLFASAFTVLEGASVTIRRDITLDEIVGRAYSMSTCAPERLGERRPAFESDLRAALAPLATDGKFVEVAEMVALLARRPGQEQA
ncbi:MAG TPA: class I SAM-dependent methyltransferase [Rhizomicrobium sp.]|jgi:SAM-dependent methyltransferase|nr:class I SAM-dependent methyltransferase [Rhizomicrobium sp.]